MTGYEKVQEVQDNIKKWSDEAFGKYRLGTSILHHLKAEIDEVIDALKIHHEGVYSNNLEDGIKKISENKKRILYEFADCFMLLIDAASHEQINIGELIHATEVKLEINKKRKWGEANELGYFEHIEDNGEEI